MLKRLQIEVRGCVQGVGFRPTVFRHATVLGLGGHVANTAAGVAIEVEGDEAQLARFEELLRTEAPPRARIDEIHRCEMPPLGETGFRIAVSRRSGDVAFGMPADLATCADCRRELFEPRDRRFRYPFLNCTNCGPRFTIIRSLPYDRAATTMAGFAICPECRREYADPRDRRFDAQPVACPACGPQLRLRLPVCTNGGGRPRPPRPPEGGTATVSVNHRVAECAGGMGASGLAGRNPPADSATPGVKSNPCQWHSQEGCGEAGDAAALPVGEAALAEAVRRLRAGGIGAIKGLGGFHLACLPEDGPVRLLRERKQRPHKPFAVMFRDLDEVRRHCYVTPEEAAALQSPAAPVVLLKWLAPGGVPSAKIERELEREKATATPSHGHTAILSPLLAPDTAELGVFLAYTPLHHLLLAEIPALVMTSANRTDEPIAVCAEELGLSGETENGRRKTEKPAALNTSPAAFNTQRATISTPQATRNSQPETGNDQQATVNAQPETGNTKQATRNRQQETPAAVPPLLGAVADFALDHDRPILRRCDDSVLKFHNGRPLFIRRSRGYVPDPVPLPVAGPSVLACGADLKNTFCVTRGGQAFLSQHIGDLEDFPAQTFFNEASADLARLLEVRPLIVAHDLHPDYHSTRQAQAVAGERGVRTEGVQHHHAHIAAVMAENGVRGPVIGVALDGTGYGIDGTIWGGEFLVADLKQFQRVAHVATFALPGGEAAVREPARTALGLLVAVFGEAEAVRLAAEFLPSLPEPQRRMLAKLASIGGSFAPKTSSAGRLFDAAAALLGFAEPVTYEGQAAIRLQALAETAEGEQCGGMTVGRYDGDTKMPNAERRTEDDAKSLRPVVRGLWEFSTLSTSSTLSTVSFAPFLNFLFNELRRGADRAEIALAFHTAVADAVAATCARIRDAWKEPAESSGCGHRATHNTQHATPPMPVALSGGVFQNTLLLDLLLPRLESAGFTVLTHRLTAPNDSCIALGQAAVALARAGG